jgi:membrane protein required for colicin V production
MEGFTIIDGVVAVIIVLSALLAYSRGFVRESLAIAGWIVAAVLAFIFADQVQPLVAQVPVLGDFIGDSCELSVHGGLCRRLCAGACRLLDLHAALFFAVQRSVLGGLDQGLGFLFGVFRGVLLVAVAFFVYETVLAAQSIPMVEDSRAAAVFARLTGRSRNKS